MDNPVIDTLQALSPSYWIGRLGEAAAKIGISSASCGIMRYWIENDLTPQRLEQIRKHSAPNAPGALPDGSEITVSGLQKLIGQGGQGLTAGVGLQGAGELLRLSTPNPMGLIFDFGRGGGRVQDLHKYMIERLADAGAPGFEHKTVQIDGKPVEIWVDASSAAEHGGSESKVYTSLEASDPQGPDPSGYRTRAATLNAQINVLASKAIDDVHNYWGTHTPENYAKNLEYAITDGQFGERPKIIHPENPAQPPADIQLQPSRPAPATPSGLY